MSSIEPTSFPAFFLSELPPSTSTSSRGFEPDELSCDNELVSPPLPLDPENWKKYHLNFRIECRSVNQPSRAF
ncbi:hypothetical protein Hanom_Chr17g01564191 [Helianthus anomalus]